MRFYPTALLLLIATTCFSQTREKGPYTIYPIIPGVMRIEDSNRSNPAGVQLDAQGNRKGFNNCSDMYLIVGRDKALLIDLSNFIKWDARPSLHSKLSSPRRLGQESCSSPSRTITATTPACCRPSRTTGR